MSKIPNVTAMPGMNLLQVLTIVFIILKLTDNINWSWWWVLSPSWIPIAVILILGLITIVSCSITRLISKIRKK